MYNFFENIIWFVITYLVTCMVFYFFKKKLKISNKNVQILALAMALIAFLAAPSCLCEEFYQKIIGIGVYALIYSLLLNGVMLSAIYFYKVIKARTKKIQ